MEQQFTLPHAAAIASRADAARSSAATAPRRRAYRRLGPGRRVPYARLLGPALVLVIWAVAAMSGVLDERVIPAPWDVILSAAQRWQTGSLPADVLTSLGRAASGF